ncbi:glycine cleavage system protein R [Vibrio rumoiensis]|uniref:Glycine cleavage system transcriptional repressor n=1 Tax=Vibrio rumoiensis TaxID=76258 RepID=A0ABW7IT12_9VIBR|nr:ACT domain-containing protein [Vibrio rumoiensis]
MIHHLVITAVGSDRPGICNRLTQVVTHSGGNIVDSRIALFGKEFTLIMLVSGETNAITRIETLLPSMSAEHDLMVVMKRTAPHQPPQYTYRVECTINSEDRMGLTEAFTQFFSNHQINISELSAQTQKAATNQHNEHTDQFHIFISGLTELDIDTDKLKQAFERLCQTLSVIGDLQIHAKVD